MFRVRRPNKNISVADARRALTGVKLAGVNLAAPGAAKLAHERPVDVRIDGKVRALVVYVPRDEWTGPGHLEVHSSGAPLAFAEHVAFALAERLSADVVPVKNNVEGRPIAKPRSSAKSLATLPARAARVTKGRTTFSDDRYGQDLVRPVIKVLTGAARKTLGQPPLTRTLIRRTNTSSARASITVESLLDERNRPIRSFVSIHGTWDPRDRALLESLGERIGARFELADPVAAAGAGVEVDR